MLANTELNNLNKYEHGREQFFHLVDDIDGQGTFIEDALGTMYYFQLTNGERSFIQFDEVDNAFYAADEFGDFFEVLFNPEECIFYTEFEVAEPLLQLDFHDETGEYVLDSNNNAIALRNDFGSYFIQHGRGNNYYAHTENGRIRLASYFSSTLGDRIFVETSANQQVQIDAIDINIQVDEYSPVLGVRRPQRRVHRTMHTPVTGDPSQQNIPPMMHPQLPIVERAPRKKSYGGTKLLILIAAIGLFIGYKGLETIQTLTNEPTYTYSDPDTNREQALLDSVVDVTPSATPQDQSEDNTCNMGDLLTDKHPVVPSHFVMSNNDFAHVGSDFGAPRVIDTHDVNGNGDREEVLHTAESQTFNQPVTAATDGEIIVVRNNQGTFGQSTFPLGGYGKVIIARHSNGQYTIYAHLNNTTVNVGDCVTGGQQIGNVGHTGNADGSHLHYEERLDPSCNWYSQYCVANNNLAPIK